MSDRDDDRFERAAVRWLARVALERPAVGLTDLRVLVTGGSTGIGLASAELLHAEGALVMITSRHPERAAESVMTLNRVTLPELLVAPIWKE